MSPTAPKRCVHQSLSVGPYAGLARSQRQRINRDPQSTASKL